VKHNVDLIDWIIANTDHNDTIKAEEAARWFVAIQEAELIHNANTVKDTAYTLMNWPGPIDDEAVTSWLQDQAEAWDDMGSTWEEELITKLRSHFRLDN